jgi:hypothetical protein
VCAYALTLRSHLLFTVIRTPLQSFYHCCFPRIIRRAFRYCWYYCCGYATGPSATGSGSDGSNGSNGKGSEMPSSSGCVYARVLPVVFLGLLLTDAVLTLFQVRRMNV